MKINWFTVVAQVINFLLLVWLLKKFLYKPILKAVDERERKITGQLKDAADKKAIAEKEQEDFRKKNEDFDQQKKVLMDKAVADAKLEKEKLIEAAKAAANTTRTSMEKAANENLESNEETRAENAQQQVFAIAKKALSDMASTKLEEQLIDTFIERIKALKDEEKKQFVESFKSNTNSVLVKTAFDLSSKQQGEITEAVKEVIDSQTFLEFKTAPEIISGIVLSTNGYKLAWTLSEYLNSLERNVTKTAKTERPAPVTN